MIKSKFSNIKKIEVINHLHIVNTPIAPDGNSVAIILMPGKQFVDMPFSVGSAQVAISEKEKAINVDLTFSIPGLNIDNASTYNMALYNRFLFRVTQHDGTVIAIGNKQSPANFSYNFDTQKSRYNISVSWQYHRHPLFVL